jgi:hypothetical protein
MPENARTPRDRAGEVRGLRLILSQEPAKPERVGLAAERTGYWDSELVLAEYTAQAGSERLHWSQTARKRRLLLKTTWYFFPHAPFFPIPFPPCGASHLAERPHPLALLTMSLLMAFSANPVVIAINMRLSDSPAGLARVAARGTPQCRFPRYARDRSLGRWIGRPLRRRR